MRVNSNIPLRRPAACAATLLVVVGQILRLPSPLRDAATGQFITDLSLHVPPLHLLTTPLSAFADLATFNSLRQDKVLIGWLLLGYWLWRLWTWRTRKPALPRALAGYGVYLAAVLCFLAWAILIPRPAARLAASDPNDLIIDFHSHTNYSWDGRPNLLPSPLRQLTPPFTPQANMDWHRRMGYDAAFITDHNVVAGTQEAKELSRRAWARRRPGEVPYRSLEGEEVSLHDAHIAVIGNPAWIDNALYNQDIPGVLRFLRDAGPKYGGLPVMSLPEYWLHHPRERWAEFAAAGAAGFELVNAAPTAMDFPEPLRRETVELCRRDNLFVTGISDNHGWGSAAVVWNVMRIPGQRNLDPDQLQAAVIAKLRTARFDSVRVVERVKQEPLPAPWTLLDPLLGAWTLCRTFTRSQALACLLWFWALTALLPRRSNRPVQ